MREITKKEFIRIFKRSQQHGKLYFRVDALKDQFEIYVLDTNEKIGSIFLYENKVAVYGQIDVYYGDGKSEPIFIYGWIYEGKWQKDVQDIIDDINKKRKEEDELNKKKKLEILKNYETN